MIHAEDLNRLGHVPQSVPWDEYAVIAGLEYAATWADTGERERIAQAMDDDDDTELGAVIRKLLCDYQRDGWE